MHIYVALAVPKSKIIPRWLNADYCIIIFIIPTGLNAELLYPNQKAVENAVGETQIGWSCPESD